MTEMMGSFFRSIDGSGSLVALLVIFALVMLVRRAVSRARPGSLN